MSQDFSIINHGTIVQFCPHTPKAVEWWNKNTNQRVKNATYLICEHRYAHDVIKGIRKDGLKIHSIIKAVK
tara:strand:- start:735 stop:947 length:213 start_codon:yes stop_codon:yes gene_type:complete